MNILKSALLSGLVALTVPAIPHVNEIVISTNKTYENNITISWDLDSNESKHFSIEHFYFGDIEDAFIVSKNRHEVDGFEWWTFDIEGWENTDEHWFQFSAG